MSEKIGRLYTEAEIGYTAKTRAKADAEQDTVVWTCEKCGNEEQTLVLAKTTSRQCKCRRWMQWHYIPFEDSIKGAA